MKFLIFTVLLTAVIFRVGSAMLIQDDATIGLDVRLCDVYKGKMQKESGLCLVQGQVSKDITGQTLIKLRSGEVIATNEVITISWKNSHYEFFKNWY